MLGKLFAHEVKNGWRVPVIFAVVSLCMTVIASVVMYLLINSDFMYEAPGIIRAVLTLFLILYFGFMVIANTIVVFYIPARFYKQSYSDVGYLTHSLPVSKASILGAHVLSGALWMLLMLAVDVVAFLLIGSAVGGSDFWSGLWDFLFGSLMREIRSFMRVNGYRSYILIVLGVLLVLVTPFLTALQSCCAVSLGQMMQKHRVAGSVLMYFVLNFIVSILNQTVFAGFTFMSDYRDAYNRPDQMSWYLIVVLAVLLLLSIVECVAFFFISVNRMSKNLNLE